MTVDKYSKPSRSRLPAPARRKQLLDVARELVLLEGTEAITMESVAAAAGVSKTLGYAYFDNREELLLALFDREVGRLYKRAAAEMAEFHGLEAKFRAAIRVWFDVVASEGGVASVLLQSNQFRGRLGDRRQRTIRDMEEVYGRLVSQEFGIPEDEAVVLVAALMAGLSGVIDRWRTTGEPRELMEDTYGSLVGAVLRGWLQ